jgi:hypothetical protein
MAQQIEELLHSGCCVLFYVLGYIFCRCIRPIKEVGKQHTRVILASPQKLTHARHPRSLEVLNDSLADKNHLCIVLLFAGASAHAATMTDITGRYSSPLVSRIIVLP